MPGVVSHVVKSVIGVIFISDLFHRLKDTMNTGVQPPEGKTSFSGIPEAKFIDDVDSYMKGDDSAEARIKELDEVSFVYIEKQSFLRIIYRLIRNINSWREILSAEGRD